MKRPSFQFYPGDWLRSTDLRSCSVPARGLWIEMLALMHEGEPYGHLKVGKKPIDGQTLARMVGAASDEVEAWLAELEHAGVLSKSGSTIYCRRMVRDEEFRQKRAEYGQLGAEYGILGKDHGIKGGRPRNPPYTPVSETPVKPPPASASASSSSSSNQKPLRKSQKNGSTCAHGDCTLQGTRSRSTTGGPWYCNTHFDELYRTGWQTNDPRPPKGKFDD